MKKKIKRLHSEDARFLRGLLLALSERLYELEATVGHLQQTLQASKPTESYCYECMNDPCSGTHAEASEIVECAEGN